MNPTSRSQSEDSDPQGRRGLLFAWSDSKALVAHLGIFVAISAGVHFFGFYLFQVVYPVTARVEPVPSRVRLLDPAQPAVSALMRQIDDRLVFLRPASEGSDARVSLADHSAQFRPSFADRKMGFRPIPMSRPASDAGDGFDVVLPPVNRSALLETPLRNWRVGGDLSRRPVRKAELLDGALADFEFNADSAAVRLSISVDRQGDLRSVLPISGEDHPKIGDLITAVRAHLRFERDARPPAAGEEEWQSGWLEIGR